MYILHYSTSTTKIAALSTCFRTSTLQVLDDHLGIYRVLSTIGLGDEKVDTYNAGSGHLYVIDLYHMHLETTMSAR